MRLLSITALLILGSVISVAAQSTKDDHLWIPVDLKWSRIPGAPRDAKQRAASATVLYFGKAGAFVRDDCRLIRNGKSISISNGDPHAQYVGRVAEGMLDGMRIEYRLVRRTPETVGETLPGPRISVGASVLARSGLAIGDRRPQRFFKQASLGNGNDYISLYETLVQKYQQE